MSQAARHPSELPDLLAERPAADDAASSLWLRRTVLVVVGATVLHAMIATQTGLSDTEAYYASWARTLSLSYYDHPPLVAWTTWLVTRLGASLQSAAAVRIGPVLYAAAFYGLVFRLTARLFSPRAGFYAVAVLAAIPVFFFTGFLLNPEALLAPLWASFLLALLDLRDREEWWRPVVLGATVGAAFLAKYTAVLALPVTLLFVAAFPEARRWLRRPSFYLSGVVALALAAPVVAWNALRGWPSLRLHLSERVAIGQGEPLTHALVRVGTAQLLYIQPILLPALVAVAVYAALRARRHASYRFALVTAAPVLTFLLTTMVRVSDSEPHWTMMGYLPLVVAAGGLLDEATGALRRFARPVFGAAMLLSASAAVLYGIHLRSPVLARMLPHYDPALDPISETVGWDEVRAAVQAQAAKLGPSAVVVGAHNVLCGHLQVALDDAPPVYCASPRRTEFDFVGRGSPAAGPAVFVDSERYPADLAAALPGHTCVLSETLDVDRRGLHLGEYRIHVCTPARSGPS